jgi:predicted metal-dependent hydrolase
MNLDSWPHWILSGEFWEIASYVVTVIALPFAIVVFYLEQRKERQNEEEEIYQELTDEYAGFSKILLKNADLGMMSNSVPDEKLTTEQRERKQIIYDLLVSLFERAYILVYEEKMNKQTQRLWATWDDYIRFWCKRKDFREVLPELLKGEDPDFIAYIQKIVTQESRN